MFGEYVAGCSSLFGILLGSVSSTFTLWKIANSENCVKIDLIDLNSVLDFTSFSISYTQS